MKLDQSKLSLEKLTKKSLKWIAFLFVSLIISNSSLAYFLGSESMFDVVSGNPNEHWSAFVAMLVITGIVLFDFGWFREQFCIIACPYGRIQSVLMDSNSLVVAYDFNRGEPRKGSKLTNDSSGDCVNCFQCVAACPTGIDIRRGTQLECIACTSCIDACDSIMEKLKKPKGLVRYTTENELNQKTVQKWSFRRIFYGLAFIGFICAGIFFIQNSKELNVVLIRGKGAPYHISKKSLKNEEIVNHYRLEFRYKKKEPLKLHLKSLAEKEGLQIVTPIKEISLKKGRHKFVNVFFKFPRTGFLKNGKRKIDLLILNNDSKVLLKKEVPLVGPFN